MKAIEILKELKRKDIWDRQRAYLPNDEELDEAIAELQVLQAKHKELESYCEKQIQIRDDLKEEFLCDFTKGELRILKNILTKLRS